MKTNAKGTAIRRKSQTKAGRTQREELRRSAPVGKASVGAVLMSISRSLMLLARDPLNNNWISARSLAPRWEWGRRGFLAAGDLELQVKTPMAPFSRETKKKIWYSGLTRFFSYGTNRPLLGSQDK